jgi:ribonuclease P protein component
VDRRRRIRREGEFRRVRQKGRCWSADVLVVCAVRSSLPQTRFGFVVGKRQGGAVVRNRIKRRLREASRQLAPALLPGYDIVMIARGPISTRSTAQLLDLLTEMTRRAKLIRSLPESPPAAPATDEQRPAPAGGAGGERQ